MKRLISMIALLIAYGLMIFVIAGLPATALAQDETPTVEDYLAEGNAHFVQGEYRLALAAFDQALELNPDNALSYYNRGKTYGELGQFEQAIADFDRTIELEPMPVEVSLAEVYHHRSQAQRELGHVDEARSDLETALELTDDPELQATIRDDLQSLAEAPEFGGIDLEELIEEARAVQVFCTISAAGANTAQVRVGPGSNRTALLWLPPDQEFPVIGQAAANDESAWWKLNKDEIPNTATEHFWVRQDQVMPNGDCDQVGFIEVNVIIPLSQDIAIENGSWGSRIVQGTIDCGSGVRSIPLADIGILITVTMDANQQILTIGTFSFARTDPGTYMGQAQVSSTIGGRFLLDAVYRVESAERIRGSLSGQVGGCALTLVEELTKF